jgi:hypothetical protein
MAEHPAPFLLPTRSLDRVAKPLIYAGRLVRIGLVRFPSWTWPVRSCRVKAWTVTEKPAFSWCRRLARFSWGLCSMTPTSR